MDAIKYLMQQHQEIAELFEQFESAPAGAGKAKLQLCRTLSDLLAVHGTVEEKIFYPATKDGRTEELLRLALEEHLSFKRIIADLVDIDVIDDEAEGKMFLLKEQTQVHIEQEEKELFPMARELLGPDRLDQLGNEMEQMADQLAGAGDPRMRLPSETERAARI